MDVSKKRLYDYYSTRIAAAVPERERAKASRRKAPEETADRVDPLANRWSRRMESESDGGMGKPTPAAIASQ